MANSSKDTKQMELTFGKIKVSNMSTLVSLTSITSLKDKVLF